MPKNLVIVESPAKAKTIQKYLGNDFQIESCYGHIVDLPKKDMGIDVEKNFAPKYVVSPDKKEVVKKLKRLAGKVDTVWLASDEDREGEAIAWHLYNELKLNESNTKRIVFNQITKNTILKAIENPRTIDKDLVDAQQARRVLDRLVGFEMSPVLWKKVRPGLSAGRVQSVAVRLIVEREKEILAFEPRRSYKFQADFLTTQKQKIQSNLAHEFDSYEDAQQFITVCSQADFQVSNVETKPGKRSPSAPFTTSTLQQEASRKLGYPVSRTMRVAQQLYEAGLITYMRTDSVNLSGEAVAQAKEMIVKEYGDEYSQPRKYATKSKGAQEAHEAIRPTNLYVKNAGADSAQNRLYDLIWKRTVASQMAEAKLERTTISIENNKNKHIFKAKGEVILFSGFLTLYQESSEDDTPQTDLSLLPKVGVGEALNVDYITGKEKYTKHPPRYSEAALVRKLEELGIGRPSTYAPTISTIQKRNYVELVNLEGKKRKLKVLHWNGKQLQEKTETETHGADKRKLKPTDIGIVVNDFLVQNFQNIMDYKFTAKVEEDFDEIASGNQDWYKVLADFYKEFHSKVQNVEENAERATGERLLGQEPGTGNNVYARIGRYGPMIQIGETEDEEKPKFASLNPNQNILTITLEEALKLFDLPKDLGEFQNLPVSVNVGRYGPYVKHGKSFVSLPKGADPHEVDLSQAIEIIKEKQKADAPIATYKNLDVTKGKGRFGPFIKWNDMFINVSKKYDFDNLSQSDIEELIEAKIKKEKEKVVRVFEEEGIRIEKARWGRHNIIQGKTKVEIPKDVDVQKLTLEEVKDTLAKNSKATKAKKTTKRKKS